MHVGLWAISMIHKFLIQTYIQLKLFEEFSFYDSLLAVMRLFSWLLLPSVFLRENLQL